MTEKKIVQITDWAIVGDFDNPYTAPECRKSYLVGKVINHEDFFQGARVQTSHIINLDWDNKTVETRNTIYQLTGEPEEGYAAFMKENWN